ncbi:MULTISPECIES: hypothetical protein [unclassified Leptolyngbya]|uniref:hypothetical protein n=1 Tax=unclassified Leptolyngbya TaxID=2650499 RepID=UPI001684C376|nr:MULTISPECIES: hypothetical protein [unclassified Leptolyngbya]MBD1911226.1 hypothetical protein [Leptolyngbya sp. FACHB-8]MBD2155473.1 hypothetical protein [Leptolyngbya sp. FACHB-16]
MNANKLNFLNNQQSVAMVITNLHELFKDNYSHYKIERSRLVSQLETAEAEEQGRIQQALKDIEGEIAIYGVLQDALSIADRVIHTRTVMGELGPDSDVYRVHHNTPVS